MNGGTDACREAAAFRCAEVPEPTQLRWWGDRCDMQSMTDRAWCPEVESEARCIAGLTSVARQPIFDSSLRVCGYELLYRSRGAKTARFENGVAATAEVLVGAAVDLGFARLLGDLPAFINFPKELLTVPLLSSLDPGRVVIEVLEDVRPDAALLSSLAELRSRGYRIGLDDFDPRDDNVPLLEYADFVKIDIQACPAGCLAEWVKTLRSRRLDLIAEKIETAHELERCRALGFDAYQGYFLQEPEIFRAGRAPGDRLATLQLLMQLHDPGASISDLDAVVCRDTGMCYHLLRCVNSTYFGPPEPIMSLRKAIAILGFDDLRKVISAILLTGLRDREAHHATQAIVRARMCETLYSKALLNDGESSFLAGLLSMMDVFLGTSLEDALLALPLSAAMRSALLYGEGTLGSALACVRQAEVGRLGAARFKSVPSHVIAQAYEHALGWAEEVWKVLAMPA